jgi:hypothetical protein
MFGMNHLVVVAGIAAGSTKDSWTTLLLTPLGVCRVRYVFNVAYAGSVHTFAGTCSSNRVGDVGHKK